MLLAFRRQRATEIIATETREAQEREHQQRDRAADDSERDAAERRITELYTKAADQLGSGKAPVRLAGLHALECLAQNTPDQRQTIVDVICAYLRMPYTPPSTLGRSYRSPNPARRRRARPLSDRPAYAAPTSRGSRHEQAQQEQQVRLTAQNILSRNLHLVAWSGTRLALAEALLLEFSLAQCQLDYTDLTRAQFIGKAHFTNAQFTDLADLSGTQFIGAAHFEWVQFIGEQFIGAAHFINAQFIGEAFFIYAWFAHAALFTRARFAHLAIFVNARFIGGAYFGGTQFTAASFKGAQFTGEADFANACFTGAADFEGAQFTSGADFEGARVASAAESGSVWPPGWTTRPAKPDNGEDPAFLYLARVEDGNPTDT